MWDVLGNEEGDEEDRMGGTRALRLCKSWFDWEFQGMKRENDDKNNIVTGQAETVTWAASFMNFIGQFPFTFCCVTVCCCFTEFSEETRFAETTDICQ